MKKDPHAVLDFANQPNTKHRCDNQDQVRSTREIINRRASGYLKQVARHRVSPRADGTFTGLLPGG